MKTQWIAFALSALTATSALAGITPGTYKGSGRWKSPAGQTGNYDVLAVATADEVKSNYAFQGQTQVVDLKFVQKGNGFFDVLQMGKKTGEGYCMTVVCHYTVSAPHLSVEESLTFYDSHLYRIGSKQQDGKVVSWEEALDLQSAK